MDNILTGDTALSDITASQANVPEPDTTINRRITLPKWYLNFQGKSKKNGLKYAPLQYLLEIKKLIIANDENNLFLSKPKAHAKLLAKYISVAAIDASAPDVTRDHMVDNYFIKFDDGGKSLKWTDFNDKHGDNYDPANLPWDVPEPTKDGNPQLGDDLTPVPNASPQKQAAPSVDFGSVPNNTTTTPQSPSENTNNSQNAINNNNTNNKPIANQLPNQPTTDATAENTSDEKESKTPDINYTFEFSRLIHWIDRFESFKRRVGAINAQQALTNVTGELMRYAAFHNQELSNDIATLFFPLYPQHTFISLKESLAAVAVTAKSELLAKGYLAPDGTQLKEYIISLNMRCGVNPNPIVSRRKRPAISPLTGIPLWKRARTVTNNNNVTTNNNPNPNINNNGGDNTTDPTNCHQPPPPPARLPPVPTTAVSVPEPRPAHLDQPQPNIAGTNQSPHMIPPIQGSTGNALQRSIQGHRNENTAVNYWNNINAPRQPIPTPTIIPSNQPQPNPLQSYNHHVPQYQPSQNQMVNGLPLTSDQQDWTNQLNAQQLTNLLLRHQHQQRPADELRRNPYQRPIAQHIADNERKFKDYFPVSDYQNQVATLNRVKEIAKGPQMDEDTRALCAILNDSTNRDVARELQGILLPTLNFVSPFFIFYFYFSSKNNKIRGVYPL